MPPLLQPTPDRRTQPAPVHKHEAPPTRGRGTPEAGRSGEKPTRRVEPFRDISLLFELGMVGGGSDAGGLDPAPLSLEGVGGEGDAAAALPRVPPIPIDVHSRKPEPSQGAQQNLLARPALPGMAAGGDRYLLRPKLRMLSGQPAQRLPGSHLEQHPRSPLQQLREPLPQAHRLPQVPRPITAVHRLLRRHPGPRKVRKVGNFRELADGHKNPDPKAPAPLPQSREGEGGGGWGAAAPPPPAPPAASRASPLLRTPPTPRTARARSPPLDQAPHRAAA